MRTLCTSLVFLLAATAHAEVSFREVAYEHDGVTLTGVLAWDDAVEGARPGVLVIHEWWGLNDYARERAAQLAEMGYVAFAADMYGASAPTTAFRVSKVSCGLSRKTGSMTRDASSILASDKRYGMAVPPITDRTLKEPRPVGNGA